MIAFAGRGAKSGFLIGARLCGALSGAAVVVIAGNLLPKGEFDRFLVWQAVALAVAPVFALGTPLVLLRSPRERIPIARSSWLLMLGPLVPVAGGLGYAAGGGRAIAIAAAAAAGSVALTATSRSLTFALSKPEWDGIGTLVDALASIALVAVGLQWMDTAFAALLLASVGSAIGALTRFALTWQRVRLGPGAPAVSLRVEGGALLSEVAGALVVKGDVVVLLLIGVELNVVSAYALASRIYYVVATVLEPLILASVTAWGSRRSPGDTTVPTANRRLVAAGSIVFCVGTVATATAVGQSAGFALVAAMACAISFRLRYMNNAAVLSVLGFNRQRAAGAWLGAVANILTILVLAGAGLSAIAGPTGLLLTELVLFLVSARLLRPSAMATRRL